MVTKRGNSVVNSNANGKVEMHENGNKNVDESMENSTEKRLGQQPTNDTDNNDGQPAQEQGEKEDVTLATICELFRFANLTEWILIATGLLVAWISGACMPTMAILFGHLTNALVKYGAQQMNVMEMCFNITFNNTAAIASNVDPFNFNNTITNEEFYDEIKKFGYGLTILAVAQLVLSYVMVACLNSAAERQVYRMRSQFLAAILRQDITWYDTHQSGEFASRASDDIAKFQDGIGEKIGMFNFFLSIFVLSITNAFITGWKLTLVMLAVTPLTAIVMVVIGKIQTVFSVREMQAYATSGAIAEEVLIAIRTVVAFGGETKESQRYEKNLIAATEAGKKKGLLTAFGGGTIWIFLYGTYALAFWYGIGLILDGEYDPSSFTIVFFSVFMGALNMGQTTPYIEAISQARAAAVSIFKIIDRVPDIDSSSEEGLKPADLIGNIEFKDITFNYPNRSDVKILDGLQLRVKNGETVALVGESGCGKSTLVQLLQRFYDPLNGTIKLDGCDIRLLNVGWLRDHIGIVGQEPVLFDTTIAENIGYGLERATSAEIEKAAKEANAHDFIMQLPKKYETLVGDRGAQLSGGQKQRVAIARALIKKPRILLLDEATSALDSESEAVVQDALDKARLGRTTIIVAHRLSTIRNADKIAAFLDGRIVEIGTHAELMHREGIYFQLVRAQTTGTDESDDSDEEIARNRKLRLQRSLSTRSGDSYTGYMESSATRKISWNQDEEEIDKSLQPSVLKVLKQNQQEWKYILAGCLGAMGMGSSTPLFSLIFGNLMGLMSDCDKEHVRQQSVIYAYIFIGLGVWTGVGMFMQIYMFTIAGEYLTERLRKLSFAAMLKQEIEWFDDQRNSVGILCSKLSAEASSVRGATGSRIGTILQAIVTMGASIIIALVLSWKLALVTMCFVPLLLASTYIQRKVIQGQTVVEMDSFNKANKLAIEAISNIRTVASLHREKEFHAQYTRTIVGPHRTALKSSHIQGAIFGIAQSIPFFAYGISMFYGGYLVLNESLDYAIIFKVSQLLIMGTTMVGNAFAFAPNYNKGMIAAAKIIRLLERKPLIDSSATGGLKLSNTDFFNIEFKDLRFSYPTRPNVPILRGLDLAVPKGKVVALVGSSGCGKSTCIQLLERFYDPISGCVTLENENISSLNIAWLRSQIGIVSQEPILFDRTIAENISYGDNSRTAPMEEIIQAAINANVHKFIVALPKGYETKVGDKGAQLSGGQKQRIAIARALLRNPKILLLDEATSALDTESERVVQEALDKAQKGRTCIVVAHRLSTIKDADMIAVIRKGKVVEIGSHDELLAYRGYYHRFYQTQNRKRT